MGFRDSETDSFPFERTDKGIWYAIILFGATFPKYSFTSSKSGKMEFITKIKSLHEEGQKYLLMGMWQGKYSTDIFILNEKTCIKKITGN